MKREESMLKIAGIVLLLLAVAATAHYPAEHHHHHHHYARINTALESSALLKDNFDSEQQLESLQECLAERRRHARQELATCTKGKCTHAQLEAARAFTTSSHHRIADGISGWSNEANDAIGSVLYQGDILLNKRQATQLAWETNRPSRHRRMAIAFETSKWNCDEPICYEFGNMSDARAARIREALEHWSRQTCIDFKEGTCTSGGLRFILDAGCWSYVGRISTKSGFQEISIGYGCESFSTICHEIGHALGLWHAQARPDRDDYISLNVANIQGQHLDQFDKQTKETLNYYDVSYDLGSIMHYESHSFAKNRSEFTIVTKDPRYQESLRCSWWPSFADVKTINMHLCNKVCTNDLECENLGYPNPRNCAECKCPPAFAGPTCCDRHPGNGIDAGKEHCGAIFMAEYVWTEVKGSVGVADSKLYDYPHECFWHIRVPEGCRIEIFVSVAPSTACTTSCRAQGIQINIGRLDAAPISYCCGNCEPRKLESESDLVVVRVYSHWNVAKFRYWFRLKQGENA